MPSTGPRAVFLPGHGPCPRNVHPPARPGPRDHEPPRVARNDQTSTGKRHDITIEPGVYIEGFGGIASKIRSPCASGLRGAHATSKSCASSSECQQCGPPGAGLLAYLLRIGIHTSIATSLETPRESRGAGRQHVPDFFPQPAHVAGVHARRDEILALQRARERLDLLPLVIHVNYLINLASLDPALRERSITSFRGELERAEAIGAEHLVTPPWKLFVARPIDQALAHLSSRWPKRRTEGSAPHVTVLLENTAGYGAQIGSRLG